ncbi:hypothetical protein QTO34_019303 [Cnephaeus nilssonii]|uniref:Uncharacterized protein n=1 Tax=Cnephaeus nilssonii TaxID=3371016 RepID=A0AA40HWG5_CNENI|nr:hypothetical protein QTO34_019303 [Eptesicus nilssonii]
MGSCLSPAARECPQRMPFLLSPYILTHKTSLPSLGQILTREAPSNLPGPFYPRDLETVLIVLDRP